MADSLAHARGWFLKGDSDLKTAQRMLASEGPYDTACFHAQQAVEKYLKGLLVLAGQPAALTHNLEELQRLGMSVGSNWPLADLDLTELTPYAVQIRYDFDFWPEREVAEHAIQLADLVRTRVLNSVPKDARP